MKDLLCKARTELPLVGPALWALGGALAGRGWWLGALLLLLGGAFLLRRSWAWGATAGVLFLLRAGRVAWSEGGEERLLTALAARESGAVVRGSLVVG
ncbi:MAG: hypothetical protein ACQKBY_10315, partial [Verrucomicrobiales bacterium]